MAEASVTLVVVAYGQRALVERLLASVIAHTPEQYDVVLVDNASPDDTVEWVRAHHPEVTVVEAGDNLGYGRGANLGARRATGDRIVLLNSDIEVTPGWLGPLLKALDEPDVAIAAAVSVDAGGRVVEAGATVTADGHVHIVESAPEGSILGPVVRVPHASASCWAFDRRWFARVGGFDPAYGLGYYEDLDLSTYADHRGWSVVVVNDSRVRHDVGGSFGGEIQQRLSHRNHRRALARWEWARRGVSHPVGHEHRLHGCVLLVGFGDAEASAIAEQLGVDNVGVHALAGGSGDICKAVQARQDRDDVVVVAPWVAAEVWEADLHTAAPRATVCALEGLADALTEAGIAGSKVPRQPLHPLLGTVRRRPW
ncbi:MAG: glycosyltransferase family 2 protein [Actinomycetota bacterium]|nr:glycosyltransferase family 2 protein [Actinomycetota bacterium]